jgi:hypothetical protein
MSLPLPELPAKDQAEAPPAPPTAPAGSNMSSPKKSDIFVVKGAAAAALLNPELARLAVGVSPPSGNPRVRTALASFSACKAGVHASCMQRLWAGQRSAVVPCGFMPHACRLLHANAATCGSPALHAPLKLFTP